MPILLLLAALTAPPAPIDVTIAEVAARPAAYDGKWLRLRGQIDQCTHFGCALCPEDATEKTIGEHTCLPLVWDPQRGSRRENGADFDPVYRYASVELVARFDQACWTGICLDRAPVLFDTHVIQVTKRRPSALGLNASRARDRMIDPSAAVAAPLIALAMRIDQVTGTEPIPTRYRVFADPHDAGLVEGAIVCESRGLDSDPATWPVDETSATMARSTEDRFRCHFARHNADGWMITPD